MKRAFVLLSTCLMLAACGDPLSDVERLSTVELAEDAVVVGALPDASDEAVRGGLFSGLFGRRDPAPAPTGVSEAVAEALADEGAQVGADTQAIAQPPAQPERRGLFGFMRKKEAGAAPVVPETPVKEDVAVAAMPAPEPEKLAEVIETAPAAEARPRRGLFGMLSGARAKERDMTEVATVQTASLGPVTSPLKKATRRTPASNGPDAQIVPFGTRLPAGTVARVCDLPAARLGKEVGKFPERGRGYKIFDSDPRSSGPRPFYVTGFKDKCARTFTASLALFGSPTMHEQLRYGLPSKTIPYSTTDKAYEGIKRSICGVGKQKPCGSKIGLLEKDTAFVSIYDRLGSNSKWSNLLLHKGWVLAADRK